MALDMAQFPFMSSSHVDRSVRKAIMLGREPARQQKIDEACEIIRSCAYNLSLLGVLRTEPTPGRGGTRYSTWRLDESTEGSRLTTAGVVSADRLWERITHFPEQVVPVAEQYRVRLACDPHDPGVPPTGSRGVARVLGTVDGLKPLVAIQASPYHGLNQCLGMVPSPFGAHPPQTLSSSGCSTANLKVGNSRSRFNPATTRPTRRQPSTATRRLFRCRKASSGRTR